ncbi:DNA polymerase I A, chloroplastic/mitochondrial-like isoform X2 [Cornus florida]|nr:DNA polymerase I A, chloroplastic/mitochondrial-like isoform X2 [Cornus florida]XP_059665248.1 DNA polymerase I A, chloroplastic/mitochondrial-like isoform X2 [Cornus florida]
MSFSQIRRYGAYTWKLIVLPKAGNPSTSSAFMVPVSEVPTHLCGPNDSDTASETTEFNSDRKNCGAVWSKPREIKRKQKRTNFGNGKKNAQGKREGLQEGSGYKYRSSSVPASINISGSESNHARQKDLNSEHSILKDFHPNGLLLEKLSEERKETSPELFETSTAYLSQRDAADANSTAAADDADEIYFERITDEEAQGVSQSHLHESLAHIYDKVLVVDNISVAKEVVKMLTTQYRHHVHACDTEVAKIDVRRETPIDHGELICFSIYSEPAANFGNGKSCIWVDVLDGGGRSLLAEFAPFFEDPSIKKVWHNYSFDSHVLQNYRLKISGFHADTMHMARLCDSSRRIEALKCDPRVMSGDGRHLDENLISKVSMVTIFGRRKVNKDGSEGKIITIPPIEELQRKERKPWICYSAFDSISTLELYKSLKSKLVDMKWKVEGFCKGTMFDFYTKYWCPFGELLVEMEKEGMLVDQAYLAEIEKVARAEQQVAENRFRNWASKYCPDAKYMNIRSDDQLRQLFFGGIQSRKDRNKRLPIERDFKVPNIQKVMEEGEKTQAKCLNIKLHSLGPEIQTEIYNATGWPTVRGVALKTLAGKFSAEFDFMDEAYQFQSDDNAGNLLEMSSELSESKERAASGDTESAYGTAYAAFGGGQSGKEACHAIAALFEVCSIESVISNFILPFQGSHVSGKNGRVHCSLNINTETGRLSARRPNFENQPALEKDRYKIRRAFIAAPGNSLIVADYGQLELRIIAHLANCKSMLDAFKAGRDFHSRTAMNMYPHVREAIEQKCVLLEWHPQPGEDKPPFPLLKDSFASERMKAKMLNFYIASGITPAGLARDWKVSENEAHEIISLWYSERQEVRRWKEIRIKEAQKQKCVHTLLGRACRFPSMYNATPSLRGHIERAAINTPVQGSAADVVMCAMLEISKNDLLKELGWRLLLQSFTMSEISSDSTSSTAPSKTPAIHACNSDSHSVQITNIRLNGDNFLRWSQSVRLYIRGQGKIGYLTGDKKAPKKEDSAYSTWDAENSMVMIWLVNSMEEDISCNYMCYPTAKELWDNINQMYSDLGNQSQIFELTLKLGKIRQGEDNITKYFNSLKRPWQDFDLFNDYEWKSPEDCDHNKRMVENNRIYKFLAGLNVEFDEVRGRIIGQQPLPSIGEVFTEVRCEESRRNVMLEEKGAAAPVENSALVASDASANKVFATNQRRQDERLRVWCDFCNRPRHIRETCWKIHGKPANWKSSKPGDRSNCSFPSANEAETGPFSKEQMDHLLKLLKSNSSLGTPSGFLAETGS